MTQSKMSQGLDPSESQTFIPDICMHIVAYIVNINVIYCNQGYVSNIMISQPAFTFLTLT
jgi:hypothetical protein